MGCSASQAQCAAPSVKAQCAAPSAKAQCASIGCKAQASTPQLKTKKLSVGRRRSSQRESPVKLFAEDQNLKDKLVGVVVTIFEGSSYDEMFCEVQPSTVPGERVSTYRLSCCDIAQLHNLLTSTDSAGTGVWRDLVNDVRQVPSDSVVFNWECCSGCGDHYFPTNGEDDDSCSTGCSSGQGGSATMSFMGYALRQGFTVMCSDFSLKSLLAEWSEEHLGPKPFIRLGECDERFCLEFIPAELKNEEVPQQLQVVGELCAEQGKAVVGALGGTIVYTVDPKRPKTDIYDLKVLTVVTDHGSLTERPPDHVLCSIGHGHSERRGVAGHVTLTYKGGGQLITSNGHWIELTRIDANLDSVMRVAERNFGQGEVDSFRQEYEMQNSADARTECVQKRAQSMVQKSVATRMKARTKF